MFLRNLISTGIIGTKKEPYDIIGLLEENKVPVIQTNIQSSYRKAISAYLAPILREILTERQKSSKNLKSRIPKPTIFYSEEFQTVHPADYHVSSKEIIKDIDNVGRSCAISRIGTCPSFSSVIDYKEVRDQKSDVTLLHQTDLFITAKMSTKTDRTIINSFLKDQKKMNILTKKLFIDKGRKARGLNPANFGLALKTGEIKIFNPLVCFSNCKREGDFFSGGAFT